jgi:hypothetical protein
VISRRRILGAQMLNPTLDLSGQNSIFKCWLVKQPTAEELVFSEFLFPNSNESANDVFFVIKTPVLSQG